MKLYLPTSIATLMLLGVPSFSAAVETKFERGREAQNQYADEERNSPAAVRRLDNDSQNSPELRRRILDHNSQPRLYYNNYDAVQSNINSFAATSSSQFDIRHAFCYTWDGQAAQPNPSWPVMHTREPHRDCVNHCIDLRGCTGWEWRQSRNECHFFDTRTGGNFLPSSGSEICGWML